MPEAVVTRAPTGKFQRKDAVTLVEEMTDEQFQDLVELGDRESGEEHPHVREQFGAQDGMDSETETIAAPKQVMYTPNGARRTVSRQDLRQLLKNGWTRSCPICRGKCQGSEVINGCPSIPPIKFSQCPVCTKRIGDHLDGGEDTNTQSDDPNFISITAATTPEARIRARLASHMLYFHPQSASLYGFTKRDAVQEPGG